jgi:hypothetical protein
VLLQDLPKKTFHRLLKSVTWTEVEGTFPIKLWLRRFIGRAAQPSHWVMSFRETMLQTKRVCTMQKRWQGKESRWGDRVRVNIPVQVSAKALAGADGCMKNLSLSGALVKSDVDLGLHALIHVSIKMPPPSQRAAAITAYVSRKVKDGVGVEWCEFAPGVVKDLLRSPSIPLPG